MRNSGKSKLLLRLLIFLCLISALVFIDQWTKMLAVNTLKNKEPFVILDGVLEFSYLENEGAAFGTMKGMRTVFLFFAPLVSTVLLVLALKYFPDQKFRPLSFCFLFIIAGAIGNFIDRLRLSYVVDFIYFRLIDFPVFNVADIYVTCASIVLILLILFKYKDEDFEKKPDLQ